MAETDEILAASRAHVSGLTRFQPRHDDDDVVGAAGVSALVGAEVCNAGIRT